MEAKRCAEAVISTSSLLEFLNCGAVFGTQSLFLFFHFFPFLFFFVQSSFVSLNSPRHPLRACSNTHGHVALTFFCHVISFPIAHGCLSV